MKSLLMLFFLASLLHADGYDFPDRCPEIYQNCEVLPLNRHGWYLHGQFRRFFSQKKIKTVVEVGAWTGNNTIYLAGMLPKDGMVFAVDHWLGSKEHQDPGNSGEYSLLPTLFQQFLSNVIHTGMVDKIIPVRMESLQAANKFRELNIKPDLIYIDGAHDYNSVVADILHWFSVLQPGGILCGDDWNLGGPNGDVSRAVKDFATLFGLKICVEGEFWWYDTENYTLPGV